MNVRTPLRLAAAVLIAGVALAQDPPRFANLDDGVKAAKKSGKPLLVLTYWKTGVCGTCDTWNDRVPRDADVQKQLPRFERVDWLYDGLGGKVIAWTKQHGGTNDDPAIQAFVMAADTGEVTRAPTQQVFAPAEFAKWMKEQADGYEKTHPATRLAFAAAEVTKQTEGTTSTWTCAAIDEARKAGRPVLVYLSRGERADADKAGKAQAAACRKLEKGALDSADAAKAAEGVTLVKLDAADADHLAYARSLGADKAPALLLLVPGEEKPQALDAAITADALAFRLRKLARK